MIHTYVLIFIIGNQKLKPSLAGLIVLEAIVESVCDEPAPAHSLFQLRHFCLVPADLAAAASLKQTIYPEVQNKTKKRKTTHHFCRSVKLLVNVAVSYCAPPHYAPKGPLKKIWSLATWSDIPDVCRRTEIYFLGGYWKKNLIAPRLYNIPHSVYIPLSEQFRSTPNNYLHKLRNEALETLI